jgi:hypothetical protein
MAASLRSVQSVLLSVLVLLIGHGLQLTLLPLTAQSLGWSGTLIGLTGSAYYLGFIVGLQPGRSLHYRRELAERAHQQ